MSYSIENYEPHSTTIQRFAEDANRIGMRSVRSRNGNWYWLSYERGSMMRFPTFETTCPTREETTKVLWNNRVALLSFIREPDIEHPANAWLYLSKQYELAKLDRRVRSNVKRALELLRYEFIDWSTLAAKGYEAYHDTRSRVGLDDYKESSFHSVIQPMKEIEGLNILACWSDEFLAGYIIFRIVDDYSEMLLHSSANRFQNSRLNNGLYHHYNEFVLNTMKLRLSSIGLSSLQLQAASGLHKFKTIMGYEAIPVHREFILHPVLRPLLNRSTYPAFATLEKFFPHNRYIRKLVGTLHTMLHIEAPVTEKTSGGEPDETESESNKE